MPGTKHEINNNVNNNNNNNNRREETWSLLYTGNTIFIGAVIIRPMTQTAATIVM